MTTAACVVSAAAVNGGLTSMSGFMDHIYEWFHGSRL
jgi:hypothetical protein